MNWNAARYDWLKDARGHANPRAKRVSVDNIIECIVHNGTFHDPLPLPQLIDVVNDLWEMDGHFD